MGWDRRTTRSQRDFVDRSRSARGAQPAVAFAPGCVSSGRSDHRRDFQPLHRNGNSLRSTCGTHRVPHGVLLELVTDGARGVRRWATSRSVPEGAPSATDAHNATATRGHRDQDVNRIGCGAVDRADLGHRLDRVEDVDREPVTQEITKLCPAAMASALRVASSEFRIVAGAANQPWPGGFAEGQPNRCDELTPTA